MKLLLLLAALALLPAAHVSAQGSPAELIKASEANPLVKSFDDANVVIRPPNMNSGGQIAIFMPGTGGKPENTRQLLHAIAGQGYRAIGLAYNDDPAVGQVCHQVNHPECAAQFREVRIWGTGHSNEVSNSAAESIVGRLVTLLKLLDKRHPAEGWGAYLTAEGKPVWSKFVVSGLSQGAGMAAFIAKKEKVARVVCFSSPIDSTTGYQDVHLAPWLTAPSATPMDRWYAVRNAREPFNHALTISYPAMGIPADHILVFSRGLPSGKEPPDPKAYHGTNVKDTAYLPEWKTLYGTAN